MTFDLPALLVRLQAAFPDAPPQLRKNPGPSGQDSLLVPGASLVGVCRMLRDEPDLAFDLLTNVSGVDWPDSKLADAVAAPEEGVETPAGGFLEVVYHLYSTTRSAGPLVLRCRTENRGDRTEVPSVTGVYRGAEFQEREVFDLYGVVFSGHPDLRRILMWDEFTGHPMRKDYVAPDDYEYEPTPHADVLEKARKHYPTEP